LVKVFVLVTMTGPLGAPEEYGPASELAGDEGYTGTELTGAAQLEDTAGYAGTELTGLAQLEDTAGYAGTDDSSGQSSSVARTVPAAATRARDHEAVFIANSPRKGRIENKYKY
jgi:hypothetical protein